MCWRKQKASLLDQPSTCAFTAASVRHDRYLCHWLVSVYTVVSTCMSTQRTQIGIAKEGYKLVVSHQWDIRPVTCISHGKGKLLSLRLGSASVFALGSSSPSLKHWPFPWDVMVLCVLNVIGHGIWSDVVCEVMWYLRWHVASWHN